MKKTLVSVLVLVLVVVMIALPLASCVPNQPEDPNKPDDPIVNPEKGYVDDGKTYTYRMAPSELPDAWNVQTYQSNSATYVLDYSSDSLYTFAYNSDFTGFEIVPSMAAAMPVDVTADYVGKYGVTAGEKGKVWKIQLKDTLKFDNGEKLDAYSFVESMKLLLDPQAANFRADNVYQSTEVKLYNAENYVKQNSYAYSEFVSANYGAEEYVNPSEFTTTAEGTLQYNGMDVIINVNNGGNWGGSIKEYMGENVTNDAEIAGYAAGELYALIDLATGERVAWRTTAKVGEGDAAKYLFFDLTGAAIEVGLNEEKTAYLYNEMLLDFELEYPQDVLDIEAAADEKGYTKLTPELLKKTQDLIAQLHGRANVEEYAAADPENLSCGGTINYAYVEFEEMAFFGKNYGALDFAEVGFFATSPTELCIALKNSMEYNFFFKYDLCTSFFLVYAPLYKQCIEIKDGVYTNSYGTSVDTYVGFGPYKLDRYTNDAEIVLVRNTNWHGYLPGEYKAGTYMTDNVSFKKVTNESTRLEMFLKGEIDSYSLQEADMEDYLGSDYTFFTDSESTWYLAMNPDMATLTTNQASATPVTEGNAVVKTVLTINEFRQALSYALDRAEFNKKLSPTSGVAKALLSSFIVADAESGLTYRAMDEAKDAILEFWGLADAWGEGKEYATRDEAIDSITGFDPAGAKALFTTAYNKAVEQELIPAERIADGKWEVQIVIGKPSEAKFYNQGFEILKTIWTDAVVGTPFEGHLSFVQSQVLGSTSFGTYLRNGSVDILFGVGYGGSQFNPYSMMDCFTGSLQYDPFTNKKAIDLDITFKESDDALVSGKTLRASLYDWCSVALQGDKITATVIVNGEATEETVELSAGSSDPNARRVYILAAVECKVLTLANIFPIQTDASAALRCMRITFKTDDYVVGMGFGGIEWYTYAMDDAEFLAYAASQQGGTLNYK